MRNLNLSFAAICIMFWLSSCTSEVKESNPANDCSNGPSLSLVSQSNSSCGQASGSIVVNATGGSGNLSFSIDGVNFQTTGDFNDLEADDYTILVKDDNNCEDNIQIVIGNDDGVNFTFTTTDAGCNTSNGSITVNASGGPRPYEYKLESSGSYQSDSTFLNLSVGTYDLFVKDANGCESSQSATLQTGVPFSAIKTIVQVNCAVSGCHAGSISPNLTTDANIRDNASRIKVRTGALTMPPPSSGKSLTTSQIEQIACWVDDGASL